MSRSVHKYPPPPCIQFCFGSEPLFPTPISNQMSTLPSSFFTTFGEVVKGDVVDGQPGWLPDKTDSSLLIPPPPLPKEKSYGAWMNREEEPRPEKDGKVAAGESPKDWERGNACFYIFEMFGATDVLILPPLGYLPRFPGFGSSAFGRALFGVRAKP